MPGSVGLLTLDLGGTSKRAGPFTAGALVPFLRGAPFCTYRSALGLPENDLLVRDSDYQYCLLDHYDSAPEIYRLNNKEVWTTFKDFTSSGKVTETSSVMEGAFRRHSFSGTMLTFLATTSLVVVSILRGASCTYPSICSKKSEGKLSSFGNCTARLSSSIDSICS